MHSMDSFSCKNIEHREACQVAGMKNHVGICKAQSRLFYEPFVWFQEMRIRKNANGNHKLVR
jgi:hypothetical protein